MAAQDSYYCRTDIGEIEISPAAMARVVLDAVNATEGRVLVSNKKGKQQTSGGRFGSQDIADAIEIEVEEEKILIRLHVIVRFGCSMKQLTQSLSEQIRKDVLRVTGISPSAVIIHVTGTLSKRIAPRDLEYRTDYED